LGWPFRRKSKDEAPEEQQREQEQILEQSQQGLERTRRTWFSKVAHLFRSAEIGDELWEELEEALVSADVGMETTSRLLERVQKRADEENRADPPSVLAFLKDEMVSMLDAASPPDESTSEPTDGPMVVLVVGVNGAGKTTTIAKLANRAVQDGKKVILGAADTFRAAAIDQLEAWGKRLGVEVIAHQPGSDPGAVAHDTLEAARARKADIAIIDTAGRLHTKTNLMEELKKVYRVVQRLDPTAPHQTLLVLDATTGQNGLTQAHHFTDAVNCDGVVLAKLDGTAKGGIVLPIAEELKLPVLFVGTGEGINDLTPFDPRIFIEALFASEYEQAAPSR
jgi:fused signal recognition particle receptor